MRLGAAVPLRPRWRDGSTCCARRRKGNPLSASFGSAQSTAVRSRSGKRARHPGGDDRARKLVADVPIPAWLLPGRSGATRAMRIAPHEGSAYAQQTALVFGWKLKVAGLDIVRQQQNV